MNATEFQALAARFDAATSGRSDSGEADVESLLRFDNSHPSFLSEEGVSSLALVRAYLEAPEPEDQPAPFPRVAGYTVLRTIGEGGMGLVFEAEQDHPRRRVALKVMRWGRYAGREHVARFAREIDALGRLQHPRIVAVYQAGRTEDGELFYTMEHADGVRLDKWFPGRTLDERLRVVVLLCEGVQHAHEHGVIHRDLKPANVIIGDGGEPKILDYGLARLQSLGTTETPQSVTQPGGLFGTLAYMSPERVAGAPDAVGPACDVYALGAILYEIACARAAFELVNTPWAEVARKIEHGAFPRPSEISPDVSPALESVILRAMALDPAARYASAAALGEDLQRIIDGRPVNAASPRLLATRRGWLVASLLIGAVLLLLGAPALRDSVTSPAPSEADPDSPAAELDSNGASAPETANDYWLGPRLRVSNLELREADLREELAAAEARGAERRVTGPLIGMLALVLEAQGEYAEAELLFRRNLDDQAVNRRDLAESRLARCMSAAGKTAEADALFRNLVTQSLDPSTPAAIAVEMRCAYGVHLARLGEYEAGEAVLLAAAGLTASAGAFSDWAELHCAQALTTLYDSWGKPDLADEWRRHARSIAG